MGGSGGVSVYTNNDCTATCNSQSWNFATNGATITVSTLIFANGQTSGNKVQMGVLNSTTNGFNSNSGVEFETFRFIPASATSWNLYEQYKNAAAGTTTSGSLGTINVIAGHWYKYVVGLTNTSGSSGNISAGCALYDYGTSGLVPGTNAITFSTVQSHTNLDIATNTAVWAGIRAYQNAGISAFDNFLVFTSNSAPTFTLTLSNMTVGLNNPVTFSVLADGPGTITYAWYTNRSLVAGVTGSNYTITPSNPALTNVMVVASNSKGSATNQATVNVLSIMTPIALSGFNRDVVIENTASGPPYAAYAQEFNAGEGTCFYQHGLPGTSYGMPASGSFNSAIDQTLFQFQPYTANNALVMSTDTGITTGTLTLINPATYSSISLIANSGSATATSTGVLTLYFADGSTYVTNYDAADWFFNSGFALQGVDRINISSGTPDGTSTDPRFYQTTVNLAAILGASNQTLVSMSFGQAPGSGATGVYAVSGLLTNNNFALASVTNSAASGIEANQATFGGTVLSTGSHAPQITIYYGTTNGGTNLTAWQSSTFLGFQSGNFSQTVAGLQPGTTYYFTARAVNSAGVSWATPSQSFTTLGPVEAQIANVPAANVTANTATLAANVLSTGGSTPTVTIFYGLTNGGFNPSNWAGSFNLGLESGYCAVTVPGLAPSTSYYFTAQASNADGIVWASPSQSFTTLATNPPSTLVSVLTYHNDVARDGQNTNETRLTPANVNTNTFGKLFSYSVDGYVFAQPLIATNVNIPGKGLHNVVIVVTENDSIYAFDADSNEGPNANPLWHVSFINAAAGVTTLSSSDVGTSDITPEVGSTATPVIDPSTGTLYMEVKTKEVSGGTTTYVHRLHALDITTGAERVSGVVSNSPVVIAATNYPGIGDGTSDDTDGSGHVLWNALREHSRPALTLLNGVLYIAYASHGDNNPYHGWLFSYNAHSLAQLSVYNTTPNGLRGGIWQGGGGATVDPQGNFYYITGNGNGSTDFNATGSTFSTTNNFAMSVLKFVPSNGVPVLTDFFTPYNQASLTSADSDLGSGAALVLPDSAGSAAHPHLLAAAGKAGKIYLIDRDNMGHFNSSGDTQIVQVLTNALGTGGQNGSYMTPAFFNNTLYYIGMNSTLHAFSISNAVINSTPIQTSTVYGDKGSSSPSISANGTSNAIVWATESDAYASSGPGILHAYVATNVAHELYNSSQNLSRDNPGGAVKFSVPTVANGKVYVGTEYQLSVFGLGAFLPAPTIQPNGGVFTNSITISFSDSIAGASFYYTLDGSIPTTNSIHYSVPFVLTNTAQVQVIAVANGTPSPVTSADFVNSAAFGNGTGLVGAYFSNQVGTFNPPAALVRTDATINFNWQSGPPAPSVSATNFSVRWTGCVQPQFSETYTFSTFTDAGVRLWINGQLLIDHFTNQPATQWSASIPMVAQQLYNIEMEYFYQNQGTPIAELSWASPSTSTQPIPETQLYPVTNPPPSVVMTSPTNGATLTGTASVTLAADAAAQSNAISQVTFFINGQPYGASATAPYAITATGLAPGTYTFTAVASDTTGFSSTSAPVNVTVVAGSGLAYGMTNYPAAPAFYNMPPVFSGPLPTLLSMTGVFSNTPNMTPVSSLIPYSPNVPLWSDGALKTRYFSIPNSGAPLNPGEQIAFAPTGAWSFPSGTLFVKTFSLLTNQSDPASIHRLETRFIVRDTNGAVYGVTYKWRPDNSDADLLTNSLTESIPITTPAGVITQNWYYPSPSDCLQCHTPAANYVLGVNARQLNGNFTYPNGVTDNQLRAINRTGLFYPAIDESSISNIETLFSLTNQSASFEQRGRSYLDANCAQCHQPGGTGPTFDARFDTPLTNQNIIYGVLSKGNLGYDNACVLTPDDVWRSVLWDRINSTNSTIKMPPLARNLIDTNAVAIIGDWINSLPGTPALPPPTINPAGGLFTGYVSVSLQSQTNNTSLYYTLDGSLPTTNSFLYTGPFTITSNVTVNASAWESGFVNSVATSASFNILPGIFFAPQTAITNGQFEMTFWGPTGHHYVLQTSTNLVQWTSISTNYPSAVPFEFTDSLATNSPARRFYRVLQQP
ncbi:MAG TPA: PA14 domain-containing protein [Verrucomicrobiae bacterium]|nr:PA14 domain-containing protein [Verrucomicrobiae bacterium]